MRRAFPAAATMLPFLALLLTAAPGRGDEPWRLLKDGELPADSRLGKPVDLNGYFPMRVPADRAAWEARRQKVREQVLVATGLWPLPPKTPLKPVIHGAIDRDGYTVEKVSFASLPGHYVTGNLYRPKGDAAKGADGKRPGVLCPHGHWSNGRFFEASEAEAKQQMKQGAEQTLEGARYPLQARCAQLAHLGCVVFHYDMVGNADSKAIPHRQGFTDAAAELNLQSFMGLQTWNSMRALDFLLGLPEVDSARVGVTGASGGGTQTFMLGAVDDRPTAAFPAVMVSTAMQGGCICENCSYLRVGTGNIELAGLFAPKPLGMTGAKDWTIDIETKGLPELKALYRLYDAEERVLAKCFPEFGHNYNQVSREVMYNWFNRHLKLGQAEPVKEKPFVPVPPKELSVYDASHPRPADEKDAAGVRRVMSETAARQRAALRPKDEASLAEYRRVVGTALRVMAGDEWPAGGDVEIKPIGQVKAGDMTVRRAFLGRKGQGEQVPAVGITGKGFDGRTFVVWIHPEGKASLWQGGELHPAAKAILDAKAAILAPDVFLTGEFSKAKPPAVNKDFAGYTFGYNRPLLAQRVHDILTAVAFAKGHGSEAKVHLVGWGSAGPWVALARGLCGDAVSRTAAEVGGFRFDAIKDTADPMMLPGAVKYGDLAGLAALAAPGELALAGTKGMASLDVLRAAYRAAEADGKLHLHEGGETPVELAKWLVR